MTRHIIIPHTISTETKDRAKQKNRSEATHRIRRMFTPISLCNRIQRTPTFQLHIPAIRHLVNRDLIPCARAAALDVDLAVVGRVAAQLAEGEGGVVTQCVGCGFHRVGVVGAAGAGDLEGGYLGGGWGRGGDCGEGERESGGKGEDEEVRGEHCG
jgi:hypothetical protein